MTDYERIEQLFKLYKCITLTHAYATSQNGEGAHTYSRTGFFSRLARLIQS